MKKHISQKQIPLLWFILLAGFAIRLIFILWGAELYFDRPNFFFDSDTQNWRFGFEYFLKTGIYSNNPNSELGFFARLPGYAFFMGLFYFLSGKDWNLAYQMIGWFQTLLDVVSIYLIFKISNKVLNKKIGLIASTLYAFYPFVIVWNPVVYTESLSVFLLLAGFWYFVSANESKWKYFLSGSILGLGVLMRPQLLVFIGILGIALFYRFRFSKFFISRAFYLTLGIVIFFGFWPARNYFKYNHFVLTQDLRGLQDSWDSDVVAFMQFTYSVKSEWEPQFSSIIKNEPTFWPREAYTSQEDSLLLEKAVWLSKNCGSGFSRWRGYWKEKVSPEESCTEEIAKIYTYLRQRQIEQNPWNFYLIVPLQNLKKAIFKSNLIYEPATGFASRLSNLLFRYRTLMIILGLIASVAIIRKKNHYGLIFLGYFILLYLLLCAGTSVQMRNIEIRYFLHADVLLLIPAAWLISQVFEKFIKPKSEEKTILQS